ncbi:MAG: hypothetical protein ABIQ18_44555 [Umezawaea sp.]
MGVAEDGPRPRAPASRNLNNGVAMTPDTLFLGLVDLDAQHSNCRHDLLQRDRRSRSWRTILRTSMP